jgi:hypothetical protein
VVVVWSVASVVQQLATAAQQLLVVVQQVLKSQQLASLLWQHVDTSQHVASLSNPNTDNRLLFLGPLSAIKVTKPNNPKINNKCFFILMIFINPNNIVCNE